MMAYNAPMYPTYGNMYGNSYGPMYPQTQGTQNYGQAQNSQGIIWVDGEVGAKAYQMPAGWPQNTPLPLWDTNDTIIYLKSVNQMGMPNPLQKIHYKMDEQQPKYMGQSQALLGSGEGEPARADMSQYVRKDEMRTEEFVRKEDLERMKQELMDSIQGISAAAAPARRNTKGE